MPETDRSMESPGRQQRHHAGNSEGGNVHADLQSSKAARPSAGSAPE